MRYRAAIFVGLSLFAFRLTYAQQAETPIPKILKEMNSARWEDRSKSFDEASELLSSGRLNQDEADHLQVGVIHLLIKENSGGLKEPDDANPENDDETSGEDKSDYYSGLIDFVVEMRDERAIPALLGAATTGGMATRGIAQFGKKAVGPVIAQVTGPDAHLAEGALWVVRSMLEMRTAEDTDSHLQLKNALKFALRSSDHDVRETAILAIEQLDDRKEFVPALREIAAHDPYRADYTAGKSTPERGVYQVRHAAELLLHKIAADEQPIADRGADN
jgi:hypothetical protein